MRSTVEIKHIDLAPNWKDETSGNLNGEIHVRRMNIPQNIQSIERNKHLLSKEEMEKFGRIFREEDKLLFLAGKVGAKILCAQYLNRKPEEVVFSKTESQKPFIKETTDFHFNTAHSGDWVVFIFSETPCGIDIEKIEPDFDYSEVMTTILHEAEINHVISTSDPRREFYKLWTKKESLLKAVGTGIIENLTALNVLPGIQNLSEILSTDVTNWQLKWINWDRVYKFSISYKDSPSPVKFSDFNLQQIDS
jgi:4'-phosphopantetheinyl transferase